MSNTDTIRVLGLGDSPKLTTGFGNVTGAIYPHFANQEDFEFLCMGWMDHDPDVANKLGYHFYPTQVFDPLGTAGTGMQFVKAHEPDVVWILCDPGNLRTYTEQLKTISEEYRPALVAYVPIEGFPINENYGVAFKDIQEMGGKVVFYCESAKQMAADQFPELDPVIAYHGIDHMNFRPYTEQEKYLAKSYMEWEDLFVVGSVGVNKRTKGHDATIYTAAYLRDNGLDEGIIFYIHTDADLPTMGGYPLRDMVKQYGVEDMVLFKPDNNRLTRGNINAGVPDKADTLTLLNILPKPDDADTRKELFFKYDFLTRINCMDMYLDLSQIEGWGLPQMEAMACGVPVASPNDGSVREEIHLQAAEEIPTSDWRTWGTWHTGSRLVRIDPKDAAETVLKFKNDANLRAAATKRGLELVEKYKWAACGEIMVNTVREVVDAKREKLNEHS